MGISYFSLQSILYAISNGVSLKRTLQVGRQTLNVHVNSRNRSKYMRAFPGGDISAFNQSYADELFKFFGAESVDSIDLSDYEGATIIHDKNNPINFEYYNKYSCIFDGGCLEHIFNFPTAVKNCMNMLSIGGHLLLVAPSNNYYGHGFYQFSPELFFSLLTSENGFANTRIFIYSNRYRWYEVKSPKTLKCRVDEPLSNRKLLQLFVISQKIGEVPQTLKIIQSDYINIWNAAKGMGKIINENTTENCIYKAYKNLSVNTRMHIISRFPTIYHCIRRIYFRKKFYKPIKNFGKIP